MTTNNESSGGKSATERLYDSLQEKLNKNYPGNTPCIYKVPEELRKLNKSAYNPRLVSIGPIHNNNDDNKEEQHLKATEHIKVAYTNKLLCRIAGKSASAEEKADGMCEALKACSTAMLDLEASALNCYAENLKPIDKKKNPEPRLAEKLLIDGCFILELLYRSYLIGKKDEVISLDEPLFGKTVIMSGIRHDLLLLENQLPFFILNELFSKTIEIIPVLDHPGSSCPSLKDLVLSFFGNVMNFSNNRITTKLKEYECFHILHLIHSCYQPGSPSPDPKPSHFSHRASDLICAGVKFEKGKGKHQLDVDFEEAPGLLSWCHSAKFKIPPLSIYDCTEPFLRNLIAFEQCCPYINSRHITSYAFLMDSLIDSAADVKLLEEAQIINNYLGASEDASVLFNNICKHAVLGQFHFAKPCDDAERICKRWWPRFRTLLKRDYFSNPWSIIAFLTACMLFAIAVVQTVYTLLAYYGV